MSEETVYEQSKPVLLGKLIVLDLEGVNEYEGVRTAYFIAPVEDEEDTPSLSLWLSSEDWREMGNPPQVTVTIVPGDRLNAG